QALNTFGLIARKPFVAALAAHAEPSADRCKGLCVFHNGIHKPNSLFHGTGFFPNHRQGPPCRSVEPVTHVVGLICHLCSRLGPRPPTPPHKGEGSRRALGRTA